MSTLPSLEYFAAATGSTFTLDLQAQPAAHAELKSVDMRMAMNGAHECFSLLFVLPSGVELPQALYTVRPPGSADAWQLLMTPVRPEADGRRCLEAVFHRRKEAPDAQ